MELLERFDMPEEGFQGRMERSWMPLGALLEAFGAPKTLLGSALGRPKGTKETGFELPRAKWEPKREPGRVPKQAPKAIRAENGKVTKLTYCTLNLLDF